MTLSQFYLTSILWIRCFRTSTTNVSHCSFKDTFLYQKCILLHIISLMITKHLKSIWFWALWALIYPSLVNNLTQPHFSSRLAYRCLSVNPLCLPSNGSFLTFLCFADDNRIASECENMVLANQPFQGHDGLKRTIFDFYRSFGGWLGPP